MTNATEGSSAHCDPLFCSPSQPTHRDYLALISPAVRCTPMASTTYATENTMCPLVCSPPQPTHRDYLALISPAWTIATAAFKREVEVARRTLQQQQLQQQQQQALLQQQQQQQAAAAAAAAAQRAAAAGRAKPFAHIGTYGVDVHGPNGRASCLQGLRHLVQATSSRVLWPQFLQGMCGEHALASCAGVDRFRCTHAPVLSDSYRCLLTSFSIYRTTTAAMCSV